MNLQLSGNRTFFIDVQSNDKKKSIMKMYVLI